MKDLNILFCGCDFSGAKVLEVLLKKKFLISWVWTLEKKKSIFPGHFSVGEIAQQQGIDTVWKNPELAIDPQKVSDRKIDVLICVNYPFIIQKEYYEKVRFSAINIHGSLLPKYRGRCPNVWAIINGEQYSGVSIHVLNEKVDAGDIIVQKRIPIGRTDTGYQLALKMIKIYPDLVLDAMDKILDSSFSLTAQNEEEATFFPARKPEDGKIDWNWPMEQICNWVRALARPYPGAFTYYNGQKIIIHNCAEAKEWQKRF